EAARYDLLVEPSARVERGSGLARFAAAFDRGLAEVNVEYGSKRASARLARPRLCVMREGWAERRCRAEVAGGRREIQHKRCVMHPEWDEQRRNEVMELVYGIEREEMPACAVQRHVRGV